MSVFLSVNARCVCMCVSTVHYVWSVHEVCLHCAGSDLPFLVPDGVHTALCCTDCHPLHRWQHQRGSLEVEWTHIPRVHQRRPDRSLTVLITAVETCCSLPTLSVRSSVVCLKPECGLSPALGSFSIGCIRCVTRAVRWSLILLVYSVRIIASSYSVTVIYHVIT